MLLNDSPIMTGKIALDYLYGFLGYNTRLNKMGKEAEGNL